MADVFRYAAFISYSSKDEAFARRLHRALERYVIPKSLGVIDLTGTGRFNRVYPVFRDREELAAGGLSTRIDESLRQSASLILVCSPHAAASHWVEEEAARFRASGRGGRIFAVIAPDVEADAPLTLLFPPSLRGPAEPLAADARKGRDGFRGAVLKLVAGLAGLSAGGLSDRDRARRRLRAGLWSGAAALIAGLALLSAAWFAGRRFEERANMLAELARAASDAGYYDRAARFALAGLNPSSFPLPGFGGATAEIELRRAASASHLSTVLPGHTPYVTSTAFSPDGTLLFTSTPTEVRLWHLPEGQLVWSRPVTSENPPEAVFAPDGATLAIASGANSFEIWQSADGVEMQRVAGAKDEVIWGVAYSPRGDVMAATSGAGRITFYDTKTAQALFMAQSDASGAGPRMDAPQFSPDGKLFAAIAADNTIRLWRLADGAGFVLGGPQDDAKTDYVNEGLIVGFAFCPSGSYVAATDVSGRLWVWNTADGKLTAGLWVPLDSLGDAVFAGDCRHVLTSGVTRTARLWDLDTQKAAYEFWGGGKVGETFSSSFTRYLPQDGRFVSLAAEDKFFIADAASGRRLAMVRSPFPNAIQPETSPDGRFLLHTVDYPGAMPSVFVFDLNAAVPVKLMPPLPQAAVAPSSLSRVAFGAGGKILTAAGMDGAVQILDPQAGREIAVHRFGGQRDSVTGLLPQVQAVAVSPDGTLVLAALRDARVIAFDPASGAVRYEFIADLTQLDDWDSGLEVIAFSPDGTRFATGGVDGTARVWRASDGSALLSLSGHTARIKDVRFSADGRKIVTASQDGTARVWDSQTGAVLAALVGHNTHVIRADFDPAGARVITASLDGTLRMWDAQDGRVLFQASLGDWVIAASFSPDGVFFLGATQSKIVLYDTARFREVATSVYGATDVAFSPDGRSIASADGSAQARIWDLPDTLFAARSALMVQACAGALASNSVSQFTDEELAMAPALDAKLDRDVCRPPGLGARLLAAFGL